jgi:hypothetical protein
MKLLIMYLSLSSVTISIFSPLLYIRRRLESKFTSIPRTHLIMWDLDKGTTLSFSFTTRDQTLSAVVLTYNECTKGTTVRHRLLVTYALTLSLENY